MKELCRIVTVAAAFFGALSLPSWSLSTFAAQQDAKPAPKSGDASASKAPSPAPPSSAKDANDGKQYSGMYTFLKEGEYLQITVEDAGQVTGFISRFDDRGSEKGTFIDQFFKTGKLDGGKLSFTTKSSNDVWFEFNGAARRRPEPGGRSLLRVAGNAHGECDRTGQESDFAAAGCNLQNISAGIEFRASGEELRIQSLTISRARIRLLPRADWREAGTGKGFALYVGRLAIVSQIG